MPLAAVPGMARSSGYEPRSPAQGVLYQVVRDHYETFRAQAARSCDGAGLPRFVQEEFEDEHPCARDGAGGGACDHRAAGARAAGEARRVGGRRG